MLGLGPIAFTSSGAPAEKNTSNCGKWVVAPDSSYGLLGFLSSEWFKKPFGSIWLILLFQNPELLDMFGLCLKIPMFQRI